MTKNESKRLHWLLKAIVICLFWPIAQAVAQPATAIFNESLFSYKRGQLFYDMQLYDLSRREMERALQLMQPVNEPDFEQLRRECQVILAKATARTGLPDSEVRTLNFIRDNVPDPVAGQAVYEMANYYFNKGEMENALTYLKMVDRGGMSGAQKAEIKFKEGYAYFTQKQMGPAKVAFKTVTESRVPTEYGEHAWYYLGNIAVFESKFDEAARAFQKITDSKRYRDVVPYNLTQIYFGQKNYDKVISYGREVVRQSGVRNAKEINRLVGQAYFEKENYIESVKYLEPAAAEGAKMNEEDFYQLGYAQYKTGAFKKAIPNFEQLNKTDNAMGQSAMFALADCYLRTGNKTAARNAFATASRMNFDKNTREDALFNYAKLSYELGYDRECINTLQQINASSNYYSEAQSLMSQALLNTRDFAQALSILDGISNKTPELETTLQKVCLYRAIQLYNEGNTSGADQLLVRSLQYPRDAQTKAIAVFWQGQIAYKQLNYARAIELMNQFVALRKNTRVDDDAVSVYTANYVIGYSNLKQKNYSAAQTAFTECIKGIKNNRNSINSAYVKNDVMPDAVLRAGDCNFKKSQYDQALTYYNEAVDNKYPEFEYALYQKAIILGLRKKTSESLIALEKLARDFPNSEYADDALYQTASTYMNIGQLEKANAPLKKIIDNYKGKSAIYNSALLRMGLLTYNQGSPTQAISYYKQVFQNNPEPSEAKSALNALEDIYVNDLGKPDEYAAFLETVPGYKLDNLGRDSLNFKSAQTQFENGNYDRAIEGYTSYLSKYPNGANALQARFNRGESYASLKKWADAGKDYEAVVAKGNSKYYIKALNKAAIIAYNYDKNFTKSFELYAKLEKEATEEAMKFDAQLGAMRSAYRNNNMSATSEYARKVADNTRATKDQQAAANFYIGKIAYDKKEYSTALPAFKKVMTLANDEQAAEARYYSAQALYQQKKYDDAMAFCEQILEQHSDYPVWIAKSIILQSDIFSDQGDLFNARAALEAVIENFDQDPVILNEAKDKLKKLEAKEKTASRISSGSDVEIDNGN